MTNIVRTLAQTRVCCNPCRPYYDTNEAPEQNVADGYICKRCGTKVTGVYPNFRLPHYCQACSLATKSCFVCAREVDEAGERLTLPSYAPPSLVAAYEKIMQTASPLGLVLVVTRRLEASGHSMFPGGRRFPKFVDSSFYLGLLGSPPFAEYDAGNYLPHLTVNVTRQVWSRRYGNVAVEEKPIVVCIFQTLGAHVGEPIYSENIRGHGAWVEKEDEKDGMRLPEFPLEFVIGQEQIETYCALRGEGYRDFLVRAFSLLEVPTLGEVFEARQKKLREAAFTQILYLALEEKWLMRGVEAKEENKCRLEKIRTFLKNALLGAAELRLDTMGTFKPPMEPGVQIFVPGYLRGLRERLGVSLV